MAVMFYTMCSTGPGEIMIYFVKDILEFGKQFAI